MQNMIARQVTIEYVYQCGSFAQAVASDGV
jgi:hypothetical protein